MALSAFSEMPCFSSSSAAFADAAAFASPAFATISSFFFLPKTLPIFFILYAMVCREDLRA